MCVPYEDGTHECNLLTFETLESNVQSIGVYHYYSAVSPDMPEVDPYAPLKRTIWDNYSENEGVYKQIDATIVLNENMGQGFINGQVDVPLDHTRASANFDKHLEATYTFDVPYDDMSRDWLDKLRAGE